MQNSIKIRQGSNAQPALFSAGLAIVAWAGMLATSSGVEGILGRVLGDTFSRAILTIAVWACIYGMLQLWGCRSDRQVGPGKVTAWVLARDREMEVSAAQAAEIWQALLRQRGAPLNYAVWVLPPLGFLGTVLGISAAIGEMSGVFSQGADRNGALSSVLTNLEFAFDTTFAGLIGAVPVMGLLIAMRVSADKSEQIVFARTFDPQETKS